MNKTSLLELAKKLNIPHRNCMKTKEELEEAIKDTTTRYKEIIFNSDPLPSSMAWLDKLRKQQAIDKYMYDQKLMEDTMRKLAWEGLWKNIVMDGVTMIDKRTGEVKLIPKEAFWGWILKLISHIGMINFKPSFIIFMDHKITCRRVEEIHILNGIGTLYTWRICNFS